MKQHLHSLAPTWEVAQWFNTEQPLSLESLRGKVIVVEAFQMLCPGCVLHGLPQAARVRQAFSPVQVEVLGLHTVFEHHEAMTPTSLQAFLHEYRIGFPVGVDQPDGRGGPPRTMQAYGMRGTPTLLIIDGHGRLRHHHFGQIADLSLGAEIAELILESKSFSGQDVSP
ncbi:redoxin domain-containing protein [Acidovorax sp. SDU_ACID1]|uniref:redoxin domain-containing protein n=1 Tax=Acidovorax sp. SDU_ACID1 TaxID=3136632 RepID=UPI0038735264